jgi:hypothetical protein
VHIQMSVPECKVAVINHGSAPLTRVTANAAIYDLSGQLVQARKQSLTAAADACTDVFTLDWPATGTYLTRLELHDAHGTLLSRNFYWHARNEGDLQQLNSLPQVKLDEKVHTHHGAFEVRVTNPTKTPALVIRVTLRDSKTGKRILPAFNDDNYFSLLPGESSEIQIQSPTAKRDSLVSLDGWNVEPAKLDNGTR